MRNAFIFAGIAFGLMVLVDLCRTPVHRFVGTVVEVSSWDGSAKLRTKSLSGRDTLVTVLAKRREGFVVGQVITVWSGGDLSHDASTSPQ